MDDDVNVGQEMHSEYDQVLLGKIRQYQNSIIKHSESGNDAKILSYIRKLYDMPVTVAHLQETGIGRTINSLRKYSGDVGTASKAIVYKWKDMVAREEQQTTTDTTDTTTSNHENRRSPTPDPSNHMKHKKPEQHKHSSEDRHSKHQSSSSSDRNNKKSESTTSDRYNKNKTSTSTSSSSSSHQRKDEKRDSHKSSHHSKEKEKEKEQHKKSSESNERSSTRKEEKYRQDKKRKHEDEQSPSKKKKYDTINDSDSDESTRLLIQENSIDSLSQSDENILPDSTTNHDRERSRSPIDEISIPIPIPIPSTSNSSSNNSNHKKHHKSDKHRNHDSKDSDKKQQQQTNLNGSSSSSKKSSHRDTSSKKEKEKEKLNSSSSSGSNSKSTSENKDSSKKPKSEKVKKLLTANNGIDSGSGASFAEALGMIEPTKSKNVFNKKKTSSSPTPSASSFAAPTSASASASASTSTTSTSSKTKTSKPSIQSPLLTQSPPANLLSSNIKLEPLDINISQLPEITTNYKPLGQYSTYDSSAANHLKYMTDDEALSVVISSKTQRTKVYSGNKTNWGFVPTLFQLCVRVLQDNIDALEYTGGVPYEILRPVLERATANQLLNTEYHNPYLVEDSDELWAKHCKRECRGVQRQEMESWRDMYLRCRDERDAKLKALTVNIKQSIDKCLPVRQTKLAYVDNYVKPPRAIARKQAKYGTDCKSKPLITPSSRLNSIASSSSGNEPRVSVPNPGSRAVSSSSGGAIKPKKAPLMQKTLALMKGRFGRR